MNLYESINKKLNESNEKGKLREIVFSEGTSMGDTTYVVKTDAPKKVLKDLLKRSNEVYLNGGDYEDVPNWANELENMGYTFEFMDDDYAVNSGKFEPKERYFIENQPGLVSEAENTESEYMKMFKDYCKGKIKALGTVEVETDDWDSDEENATKKVKVKVAFTQKIRDYGECKVLDGSDTIDKLDSDGDTLEFVTEKGEYINTPMITPDNLLGRLEFDAISKKCYEETLYYWNDLYMDENIENWREENLNESVNADGVYEEPLTDKEMEILQNDKTKFDEYLINKQKKALQKASYEKLKLARRGNNRSIEDLTKGTPSYWNSDLETEGLTKEDFINTYKKQNEKIDVEINERVDKLIDDFSKDPSNKELFNKTLNDISKLEYDGVINKDLYDDAIKRTQSVYVNRNKDINESENLNENAIYFIGKDEYGIVENNGTSDSEFDVLNMYYKDNLYSTELIPKNWPESKIRAFMHKVSNFVGPRGDRDFVKEVEDEFKAKEA